MNIFELSAHAPAGIETHRRSETVAGTPPGADALQREVCVLYEDHGAALLRYAKSVAGNEDSARDAVQEAFLGYYTQRSAGSVIDTPRAWLYKVIFHYLVDVGSEPNVSLDHAALTADPGYGPQATAEASSLNERFEDILSPRELSCIRLRAEGLSYDEIGVVLGIRIGTVGALLARAVRKIKKELNRE